MCYTVSSFSDKNTLQKRFEALLRKNDTDMPPQLTLFESRPLVSYYYVSGFLHPFLPVIRTDNWGVIQANRWGLVPTWVKEEKRAVEMAAMTLNAQSETAFEKPSFKDSILQKRCVVLVDGFFEWQTKGKLKTPHFIYPRNKMPFAMGGIFNDWVNPLTGEITPTFSILTTEANELMGAIHNTKKRMPLVLDMVQAKNWLNPTLQKEEIKAMMQPAANDFLDAHTIQQLHPGTPNEAKVLSEFFYDRDLPNMV